MYVGQLRLTGRDADFLAVGRALEGRSCASPVGTSAAEWQIAGRKIWNWGEKNLHLRDDRVLADELLMEPDVAALVPRIRALPKQRVAVIGHSFTMGLHWASPSAFVPIVTALVARENPGVEIRQFQGGGLTSTRAYDRFFEDVVAWKPDVVLLVVMNRTDEDLAAWRSWAGGSPRRGKSVRSTTARSRHRGTGPPAQGHEVERASGITVVEVAALLSSAPDRDRFTSDGIHMTEPFIGSWQRMAEAAGPARAGRRRAMTMDIRGVRTKAEMGEAAAAQAAASLRAAIAKRGGRTSSRPRAASQFEFLDRLVAAPVIAGRAPSSSTSTSIGPAGNPPGELRKYLRERLADRVHPGAFHFIEGDAADPAAECRRVGGLIARHPIDLAFVGIGENGHLAFNDPPADFEIAEPYIVVELDEDCRRQQLGEGWFPSLEDVPRRAISMSIRQILKSGEILCVVPDARKARAVKDCLAGEVSPRHPASILQRHPRTAVFLDAPAAALLEPRMVAR